MIQSAEELMRIILAFGPGFESAKAIRASYKAIVEACREMVKVTPIYIPGDGKREPLSEGFDAILREISG
jgi:hypothetical protein